MRLRRIPGDYGLKCPRCGGEGWWDRLFGQCCAKDCGFSVQPKFTFFALRFWLQKLWREVKYWLESP